jgi:hypothetical protein
MQIDSGHANLTDSSSAAKITAHYYFSRECVAVPFLKRFENFSGVHFREKQEAGAIVGYSWRIFVSLTHMGLRRLL